MSLAAHAPIEASQRLQRVERLLDQVLADLGGSERRLHPDSARFGKKSSPAIASSCPAMLAEAFNELQSFSTVLNETRLDESSLLSQLKNLLPRLAAAERMLVTAAEFYRGWCAAGPQPSYPAPGYQVEGSSYGPALLALEA